MDNKKLKRLMTDVAKGKISLKEVMDYIKKPKKVAVRGSKQRKTTTKTINTKTHKKEVKRL